MAGRKPPQMVDLEELGLAPLERPRGRSPPKKSSSNTEARDGETNTTSTSTTTSSSSSGRSSRSRSSRNDRPPKNKKIIDLTELGLHPLRDTPFDKKTSTAAAAARNDNHHNNNLVGVLVQWMATSLLGVGTAYWAAIRDRNHNNDRSSLQEPLMAGVRTIQAKAANLPRILHKPPPPPKRTPADDHPLALQSEAVIKRKGIVRWLFSAEKLPWTLSAVASLVYLAAFISRVGCDKHNKLCWPKLQQATQGLHNGFCVWGSDATSGVCASQWKNSHQYSFYVDMGMTLLAFGVGHLFRNHPNGASFRFTFGIAAIIGLHGLLHLGISNGVECGGKLLHCDMACPNAPPHHAQPWQWVLYGFYNLGLVVLNFVVANFRLPKRLQAVLVGLVTGLFVALGAYLGGAWALPAVFVQTHVMASLSGVFANQWAVTPASGWCFLGATLAGMTEFLACQPFLLDKGGHVWYDGILHLAMVATLVPRNKNRGVAP